ncbi:hypothetical protein [Conexivisphaera calida]|uniref:Uncharacterized protein n=1 Tax=Conexivisphaera calida TaxID=1874277 RepID=A0A4P2VGP6_9ARCH|nr:hypothetical protein [Conexivisphaera calida]BBE42422.1 hypothetical protein NAS2_1033 [Conexivisphaera calida]
MMVVTEVGPNFRSYDFTLDRPDLEKMFAMVRERLLSGWLVIEGDSARAILPLLGMAYPDGERGPDDLVGVRVEFLDGYLMFFFLGRKTEGLRRALEELASGAPTEDMMKKLLIISLHDEGDDVEVQARGVGEGVDVRDAVHEVLRHIAADLLGYLATIMARDIGN